MSTKESIEYEYKSELKENEDADSASLVLSTLLLDQLNLQDVNALLESQSQMFVNSNLNNLGLLLLNV